MQGEQSRAAVRFDDATVKAIVSVVKRAVFRRRRPTRTMELLVDFPELFSERTAARIVERCGLVGSESFERADDIEQLMHVRAGERRDREARLLRARRAHHESFLLQSLQRLTDGRATHAELARDFRLDDATA